MKQEAVIRGALHVGFPAQSVDTAAGTPHVAQDKLDHGHHADVLHAHRVLGPAHGVHDGTGLFHSTGFSIGLPNPLEVLFRSTGNRRNRFRGVARIMLLHYLENAARILEG